MVELMIVIAIIAVLASIIMPKMGGARNKAALSACKGNLKHLAIALEMYANQNGGDVQSGRPTYLVTSGYLKTEPLCPLGNRYYIWAHYGSGGWRQCPAGGRLVVCGSASWITASPQPHNASLIECPYTANGQVFDI